MHAQSRYAVKFFREVQRINELKIAYKINPALMAELRRKAL
jgi:hypothetical protein